ncbi:hypothetical protein T4C_2450, partial [Trichinella pseudospiralis]
LFRYSNLFTEFDVAIITLKVGIAVMTLYTPSLAMVMSVIKEECRALMAIYQEANFLLMLV